MKPTKIVLIGAASASFGPNMIGDAVLSPGLRGSTLVLVDIDSERLEVMTAYARRLNEVSGAGLHIESTPDRILALPEAEFVISSIAINRNELWKRDFQIPQRYGIRQVLGENGGPGGLSHALRNIPIVLGIARDMERLCPHALLLNFTNPESRICLAISRYSAIRFAGLCHGIGDGYDSVGHITGIPAGDVQGIAAGLNHFAWFLSLHRRSTGEDIYPLLRNRDAAFDPVYYPLTRRLSRLYGLYPHPSDNHIGEYLGFAWETCGTKGYDFEAADQVRADRWRRVLHASRGEMPVIMPDDTGAPEELTYQEVVRLRQSGEFAWPIITGVLSNRNVLVEAVNVRNQGAIASLPDWAVVEVPAIVNGDGLRALTVGALPSGITALLNTQVHIQSLVVDAAVLGRRDLALQAMLADPTVPSLYSAEKVLDELLHVHAPYLPQFAGK
jgi:alpha-galactosidase